MPKKSDDLFTFLGQLGIEVATVEHAPLFTVADSRAMRGEIAGGHTKNLFLRDRKDQFFLVTAEEDATIDLKTIHTVIGAAGRVSFGSAGALMELLGVTPGSVSVFGLINDTQRQVKVIIDEPLLRHEVINAHPLTNTATTSIRTTDLSAFIAATGHEAHVLKVSA